MATFFCPQGGRSQRGSTVASIPLMAYAAILKTKPVISQSFEFKAQSGTKSTYRWIEQFCAQDRLKTPEDH